jgi:hypothetical protein
VVPGKESLVLQGYLIRGILIVGSKDLRKVILPNQLKKKKKKHLCATIALIIKFLQKKKAFS